MSLYQIIGTIDSYGAIRALPIFKEKTGTLSQIYPGHFYVSYALQHKRWRWLVEKNQLDRSVLMDWLPDIEEVDAIERLVARLIPHYTQHETGVPRYGLEGSYPNWKQVE